MAGPAPARRGRATPVRGSSRLSTAPDDLYELRHFCAHHMYVALGLPARIVAVQLGHNDGGRLVERLYGHGDVGALEEIDRAFSKVISLRSVPTRPQDRPQAVGEATR